MHEHVEGVRAAVIHQFGVRFHANWIRALADGRQRGGSGKHAAFSAGHRRLNSKFV